MDSPFSSSSHLSNSVNARHPRPTVTLGSLFQLCLIIPAAMVIGILYHFISQYINVMFLFPVAAGWGVGRVLSRLAKRHKVRSRMALYALALVAGLTCYGARWGADSLQAREDLIHAYSVRLGRGNTALEAKAETALRLAYPPIKFFPLYMDYASQVGIGVNSAHTITLKTSTPTRGQEFWVLVMAEAMLLCGAALLFVWKQANSPFCAPCDEWYSVEFTAAFLHLSQEAQALRLVKEGRWEELSQLSASGATSKSNCEVLFCKCPRCSDGRVAVKRQVQNRALISGIRSASPTDVERLEAVRAQWLS